MHITPLILRFGIAALVYTALPLSVLALDDPVVVELTNGACVEATIDGRTDRDRLWLATSLDRGSLSQSIPWQNVRQVEIAGRSFEGWVVRSAVATIQDAAPPATDGTAHRHVTLLDGKSLQTGSHSWQQAAALPTGRSRSVSKAQTMSVSARLANWDRDVAADGLLVELTPYDSDGNPISCNGTVAFTLRSWKTSGRNGHLGIRSETWNQVVRAADFDSGSVVFRLPFRHIQPQQSSDWWSHGALQVRLTAPGSGVIERTLTDLRLRHFQPMRDMLEQRTGRRYFPGENVQRQAWTQSRR